jgi:DNA-binding transcriptional ArsR family regulator
MAGADVNTWGDVELDARGMRALAHPVRVAILERLRAEGAQTATGLAPHVGASPSVTSWHLRHLAEHGLVEDAPGPRQGRQRWWQAVGRGIRFTADTDAAAYVGLMEALEQSEGDLVQTWRRSVLPRLAGEWLAAAGRWNTRIRATPAELRAIDEAIEKILTPYVQRTDAPESIPEGARRVRILRYTMPEAPDP